MKEDSMKREVQFYHAGCSVCQDAEKTIVDALDRDIFQVEYIHLGEEKSSLAVAEKAGVKTLPALVISGKVFHINFGADLSDLK